MQQHRSGSAPELSSNSIALLMIINIAIAITPSLKEATKQQHNTARVSYGTGQQQAAARHRASAVLSV